MGLFRVDEDDLLVVGALLWCLAQEFKPGVAETAHCGPQVVHVKCQMVKSLPSAVEKPLHRRLVVEGFQELQLCRLGIEKMRPDLLFGHGLGLVRLPIQELPKRLDDGVYIVNGDAYVFDSGHECVALRCWRIEGRNVRGR